MSSCKCTTSEAFPQPSGNGWTGQYSPNQGWESERYSFRHGRMSPSPFIPMVTPAPEFNNQVMPYTDDVAPFLLTAELNMYDSDQIGDPFNVSEAAECLKKGMAYDPASGRCIPVPGMTPTPGITPNTAPTFPSQSPTAAECEKKANDAMMRGGLFGLLIGGAIGYFIFKK